MTISCSLLVHPVRHREGAGLAGVVRFAAFNSLWATFGVSGISTAPVSISIATLVLPRVTSTMALAPSERMPTASGPVLGEAPGRTASARARVTPPAAGAAADGDHAGRALVHHDEVASARVVERFLIAQGLAVDVEFADHVQLGVFVEIARPLRRIIVAEIADVVCVPR